MRLEDQIIINELKKENTDVFETLFAEYYALLVQFSNRFVFDQQVSEDIVQELFVHIWEQAKGMTITTSIKSYLFQSVRNRCLNHLKKEQVVDKHNLLYLEAILCDTEEVEKYDSEILSKITDAISALPPQMSRVFEMKLLDGLKQEEIAQKLDISVNSVKTHLKRARVQVRESLSTSTNIFFML